MLQTIGRVLKKTGDALQIGIGLLWILFLLCIAAGVALFTTWAPIIFTGIMWFICAMWYFADKKPWERSRFAIALLVAWAVDALLFRLAIVNAAGFYRHLVPGIVVVSIFAGYEAWRVTASNNRKTDSAEKPSNPFAAFGAALLAIFLMLNVVSPTMNHFFPSYWQMVTDFHLGDDSGE